jgi:hypothetical protein
MALIKCPECGAEVSSNAEICPKCAYPIAGGGTTQAHGGKVQTVEQTSKRYKLQQLLSSLLSIGSVVVMIGAQPDSGPRAFGELGFLVGLTWFIVVAFKTWWHHG